MNEKNECKHNFFPVREDGTYAKIKIVCAWCGQVRQLDDQGNVDVLINKGRIKYEV